jgi:hypothetical protein
MNKAESLELIPSFLNSRYSKGATSKINPGLDNDFAIPDTGKRLPNIVTLTTKYIHKGVRPIKTQSTMFHEKDLFWIDCMTKTIPAPNNNQAVSNLESNNAAESNPNLNEILLFHSDIKGCNKR